MGGTSAGYYQMTTILNSDNLLFPSMFLNMDKFGYSLESWQLPGALSFCPDFIICWVISFFTSNPSLYFVVYAMVHASLFSLLITMIAKQLFPSISYAYLSITNLLLVLLSLFTLYTGVLYQTFYLFMMSYHTGVYINLLWCAFLLICYVRSQRSSIFKWLMFFIWLASFSDMVFFVAFVLPTVFALLFVYPREWKRYVYIFSFGLLGLLSFYGLTKIVFFSFDLNFSIFSFENMNKSLNFFLSALKEFEFIRFIFILSFSMFIVISVWLISQFIKKKMLGEQKFYFLFYLFLMYCAVISAPIVNGSYVATYDIRYCVMSFYLMILSMPIVLYVLPFHKVVTGVVLSSLVCLCLFFSVKVIKEKNLKSDIVNFINYIPPGSQFVDDFCVRNGVNVGVATYWNSIFFEALSKRKVVLKCVFRNAVSYFHNQQEN